VSTLREWVGVLHARRHGRTARARRNTRQDLRGVPREKGAGGDISGHRRPRQTVSPRPPLHSVPPLRRIAGAQVGGNLVHLVTVNHIHSEVDRLVPDAVGLGQRTAYSLSA